MKSLKFGILSTVGLLVALPVVSFSTAYASTTGSATTSTSGSTSAADKVNSIISKGTAEIDRRLTTLNTLGPEISSSTKLNASDKSSLTNEVNSELSGLTSLKSTLAACTTIACAHTNAQSIFNDYRVYALVVPKVKEMSAADHQQQVEDKLTTIAGQLSSRIAGNNNSTLQTDLSTLNSDIYNAKSLSSSVETNVVGLQPDSYNSNHSVLKQYTTSLKTASTDNQNAINLEKSMLQALKGSSTGSSTTK